MHQWQPVEAAPSLSLSAAIPLEPPSLFPFSCSPQILPDLCWPKSSQLNIRLLLGRALRYWTVSISFLSQFSQLLLRRVRYRSPHQFDSIPIRDVDAHETETICPFQVEPGTVMTVSVKLMMNVRGCYQCLGQIR